jgi:hypothetical protein
MTPMGAEEYLNQILVREAVDTGPFLAVRGVQAVGLRSSSVGPAIASLMSIQAGLL